MKDLKIFKTRTIISEDGGSTVLHIDDMKSYPTWMLTNDKMVDNVLYRGISKSFNPKKGQRRRAIETLDDKEIKAGRDLPYSIQFYIDGSFFLLAQLLQNQQASMTVRLETAQKVTSLKRKVFAVSEEKLTSKQYLAELTAKHYRDAIEGKKRGELVCGVSPVTCCRIGAI